METFGERWWASGPEALCGRPGRERSEERVNRSDGHRSGSGARDGRGGLGEVVGTCLPAGCPTRRIHRPGVTSMATPSVRGVQGSPLEPDPRDRHRLPGGQPGTLFVGPSSAVERAGDRATGRSTWTAAGFGAWTSCAARGRMSIPCGTAVGALSREAGSARALATGSPSARRRANADERARSHHPLPSCFT